jgi:hypothetical protein
MFRKATKTLTPYFSVLLSIGLSSEMNGTLAFCVTLHLNQYVVTGHKIESVYALYVTRSMSDFQMMQYPTI